MSVLEETLAKLREMRGKKFESIEVFQKTLFDEEIPDNFRLFMLRRCQSQCTVLAPAFTGALGFSAHDVIAEVIKEIEKTLGEE